MSNASREKWSRDFKSAHSSLRRGFREFVIVACADFDAALVEAISGRLLGTEEQIAEFLGTESGRGALSNFSARVRLALLLGILRPVESNFLLKLGQLRNVMAHRLKTAFKDDHVQEALGKVIDSLWDVTRAAGAADAKRQAARKNNILADQKLAKKWLGATFLHFQLGFHHTIDTMERIKPTKYQGIVPAALHYGAKLDRLKAARSLP